MRFPEEEKNDVDADVDGFRMWRRELPHVASRGAACRFRALGDRAESWLPRQCFWEPPVKLFSELDVDDVGEKKKTTSMRTSTGPHVASRGAACGVDNCCMSCSCSSRARGSWRSDICAARSTPFRTRVHGRRHAEVHLRAEVRSLQEATFASSGRPNSVRVEVRLPVGSWVGVSRERSSPSIGSTSALEQTRLRDVQFPGRQVQLYVEVRSRATLDPHWRWPEKGRRCDETQHLSYAELPHGAIGPESVSNRSPRLQ